MAESWFSLNPADQAEALQLAAARSGRPAHLLEKDIWVVWALGAVYRSSLASNLTFKGGTSLSKVYHVIDRFSEDIDLTYDIRALVPDLLREGEPLALTSSQEKKISSAVRERLPAWISTQVQPVLQAALGDQGLNAQLHLTGKYSDTLILTYAPVKTGTGYAAPTIQLEFGARSTGEPHQVLPVVCDLATHLKEVEFPQARPLVMAAERTFWEKATAAHVFCRQGRLRGERYARHWYDLAALAKTPYFENAVNDANLAQQVASHKSMFFAEKDAQGQWIDYSHAVSGAIELVPQGDTLVALQKDYNAMLDDGLLAMHQPEFQELMDSCRAIQERVNLGAAKTEGQNA